MKTFDIFACLILLFFISTLSAQVVFQGEVIDFEISENLFSVSGNYCFVNQTGKPLKSVIFYPFPNDSLMGDVQSFEVIETEEISLIKHEQEGLTIGLNFAEQDTLYCSVSYIQAMKDNAAVYILSSTRQWRNALVYARYSLSIPDTVEIRSFSYYPDSFDIDGTEQYFYWDRRGFYPDKDFVIGLKK